MYALLRIVEDNSHLPKKKEFGFAYCEYPSIQDIAVIRSSFWSNKKEGCS